MRRGVRELQAPKEQELYRRWKQQEAAQKAREAKAKEEAELRRPALKLGAQVVTPQIVDKDAVRLQTLRGLQPQLTEGEAQ